MRSLFGFREAEVRPALGRFQHEAVAVDPINQVLYLTEDEPDGGFYRFRPARPLPELSSGVLEIARVQENNGRQQLSWVAVKDPGAHSVPTRLSGA